MRELAIQTSAPSLVPPGLGALTFGEVDELERSFGPGASVAQTAAVAAVPLPVLYKWFQVGVLPPDLAQIASISGQGWVPFQGVVAIALVAELRDHGMLPSKAAPLVREVMDRIATVAGDPEDFPAYVVLGRRGEDAEIILARDVTLDTVKGLLGRGSFSLVNVLTVWTRTREAMRALLAGEGDVA